MRRNVITLTLSLLGLAMPPGLSEGAWAQAAPQYIDCSTLVGTGDAMDPIRLGAVEGTVILVGCPALMAGYNPNNSRYYSFELLRPAPAGAVVGASFVRVAGASSAVHPRLATAAGVTLLTSRQHGVWAEQPPATVRYLPIAGLPPGHYVLGVEKLGSPLASLQTPSFNVLIVFPS